MIAPNKGYEDRVLSREELESRIQVTCEQLQDIYIIFRDNRNLRGSRHYQNRLRTLRSELKQYDTILSSLYLDRVS